MVVLFAVTFLLRVRLPAVCKYIIELPGMDELITTL